MKKLRKIILLLIAFTCFQSLLASESKEINCIENTTILNDGFEVEQLVNENSQLKIPILSKIVDWIGSWFPNWNFWQKTVGTGAGHYVEKDGTEITYPMTLYDKTEFTSYNLSSG